MLLLALAACDPACPDGGDDAGGDKGGCTPAESGDTGESAIDTAVDSGGETGGDTAGDTAGDTDTSPPEDPCVIAGLTEESLGYAVNNRRLHVTLDNPGRLTTTCTLVVGAGERSAILPEGSTWRYWDSAVVDEAWAEPDFDDSGWAEGAAPLGYGEAVTTTISYGGDPKEKYISSWFRTAFTVADPSALTSPQLSLTYDDGAQVYLNGVLVGSFNLPEGDIAPDTVTIDSIEATAGSLSLASSAFVAGENVLAVEIHQSSGATSDAWLDAEVTVVGEPGGADADEVLVVESERGADVNVDVFGLLADSTYRCEVAPSCGEPATIDTTTAPLPAAIPELTVEGTPPTPGYVLATFQQPCKGDSQAYFLIADQEGRVRWYDDADNVSGSFSTDLEVALVNGDELLWGGGSDPDAVPQIVDLAGTNVYMSSYDGVEDDVYHHDVEQTAEGMLIGLVENVTELPSGRQVYGFDIVEHDPATGVVTWSWSTQGAVDAGELDSIPSDDPWHANAMATTTDTLGPAVYVNLYYAGVVLRIDKGSGSITHTIGRDTDFTLVDSTGAQLGEESWFERAHGLGMPDGDTIILWDNGPTLEQSRAIEYRLDLAQMEATLLEEWTEGWYSPNWGDADDLGDGTWLVDQPGATCFGGTADEGNIVRIDPATDEVYWRASFPGLYDSSYRAQWIDGCALFGNRKFCP